MRPADSIQGFFGYLGLMLVRMRWLVVLLWAAVAVWAYVYLPPLDEETTGKISDLVPEDAPAAQARAQAESQLEGPIEAPVVLVSMRVDPTFPHASERQGHRMSILLYRIFTKVARPTSTLPPRRAP